jgi:hypothetical protein
LFSHARDQQRTRQTLCLRDPQGNASDRNAGGYP